MALVNLVVLLPQEPPAALSVPATKTRKVGGGDAGSLPAPFTSLPALTRLKDPPALGYDTHRGARLPSSARNHLHSSQHVAWFTLGRREKDTRSAALGDLGADRQFHTLGQFRSHFKNQTAPPRAANPNRLFAATLLQRYQEPHGHAMGFACWHGRKVILA